MLRDHGHQDVTGPGAATADVATLLAPDRMRAISVVEMRATQATPPGGIPMLGASFASTGSASVTIHLNAGSIRLLDLDGPWRLLNAPRMGLVDGAGNLLDGLYRDATIAPGGLGAWLLGAADGGIGQRVRVAGTIVPTGPVPPVAVAFEVTAPVE